MRTPNRGLGEDFVVLFANAMGNEMPGMPFHSVDSDGTAHLEAHASRR